MEAQTPKYEWIGNHRHVVTTTRFIVDDPQEEPIEELHCLDCDATEPDKTALITRHRTCPHRPRRAA